MPNNNTTTMGLLTANRRALRERLPINVRIGFHPTEPTKKQKTLPCLETVGAGAGVAITTPIKSGMLIVSDVGVHAGRQGITGWRAATAADTATSKQFFVANSDYDAYDVQQAEGLTAYDLSDNYVFETGYFLTGDGVNYTDGIELTAANGGKFAIATEDDVIVARVSEVGSATNGSFPYEGHTPSCPVAAAFYLVVSSNHTGRVMA